MIKLKPLTIQRYKCDFCNKITRGVKYMNNHEYRCYKNPNRTCDVCSNEGVEFLHTLGHNGGVIPDSIEKDCSACTIAKECGGKSYINEV